MWGLLQRFGVSLTNDLTLCWGGLGWGPLGRLRYVRCQRPDLWGILRMVQRTRQGQPLQGQMPVYVHLCSLTNTLLPRAMHRLSRCLCRCLCPFTIVCSCAFAFTFALTLTFALHRTIHRLGAAISTVRSRMCLLWSSVAPWGVYTYKYRKIM